MSASWAAASPVRARCTISSSCSLFKRGKRLVTLRYCSSLVSSSSINSSCRPVVLMSLGQKLLYGLLQVLPIAVLAVQVCHFLGNCLHVGIGKMVNLFRGESRFGEIAACDHGHGKRLVPIGHQVPPFLASNHWLFVKLQQICQRAKEN